MIVAKTKLTSKSTKMLHDSLVYDCDWRLGGTGMSLVTKWSLSGLIFQQKELVAACGPSVNGKTKQSKFNVFSHPQVFWLQGLWRRLMKTLGQRSTWTAPSWRRRRGRRFFRNWPKCVLHLLKMNTVWWRPGVTFRLLCLCPAGRGDRDTEAGLVLQREAARRPQTETGRQSSERIQKQLQPRLAWRADLRGVSLHWIKKVGVCMCGCATEQIARPVFSQHRWSLENTTAHVRRHRRCSPI